MPRSALLPVLLAVLLVSGASPVGAERADPWPVRVVVVTMFERGAVRGDDAGELQHWVERYPLPRELPFPLGEYPLFASEDGVLAICTGGGIANATASTLALGTDPRFDLSRAFWLVAGIAGGDPADTTLGSAVWAEHVVDGDLLYELDAREIPEDWPWGLVPLGVKTPVDDPVDLASGWTLDTIHFPLDPALAAWAYERTRELELRDTPAMAALRARYEGQPAAQRPPSVQRGDTLASGTYWHGERLNAWANHWVRLYAGPEANFVTTNMEDSGTLTALHRLGRTGRVDPARVLVLRTVSNFSTPPAGEEAAWSSTAPYPDGGAPAIDAAFRVGSEVVRALASQWPRSPVEEGAE